MFSCVCVWFFFSPMCIGCTEASRVPYTVCKFSHVNISKWSNGIYGSPWKKTWLTLFFWVDVTAFATTVAAAIAIAAGCCCRSAFENQQNPLSRRYKTIPVRFRVNRIRLYRWFDVFETDEPLFFCSIRTRSDFIYYTQDIEVTK